MAISGGDGSIILTTNVDQSGLNKGISSMEQSVSALGKKMLAIGATIFSVRAIKNFIKASNEAYKIQMQNEVKLATVMRQRMNATDDEIKSILELAQAQQKLGVVGDEVQLAGLQQLATFVKQKGALEELLPAMNNLIAQQYGYEATADSAKNVGNMLGKVLQGQTGALKRVGISFSEAEEKMLKSGNEMQRAATLAKIITNNVGEMNGALAKTDYGRQKQLANVWGDIKEQFGAAFQQIAIIALPLLQKLADALAYVARLARNVAQAIANAFGAKSSGKSDIGIGAIEENTYGAVDAMESLGDATEEAGKKAKKSLAAFDDLQILSENKIDTGTKSQDVTDAVEAMNAVKQEAEGEGGTIFDKIRESFLSIWDSEPVQAFVNASETIMSEFGNFAGTLWNDIKTNAVQTWETIQPEFQRANDNLVTLWTMFWTDLDVAVQTWMPQITTSISTLFNSIWGTAISPATTLITHMWADFTQTLVSLWQTHGASLLDNVGRTINSTIGLFQSLYDFVLEPIITPLISNMTWLWDNHLSGLVEKIGTFVAEVATLFMDMYNAIVPVVQGALYFLQPAISAVSTTLIGVFGTLAGTISDVVGGIIEALTGIVVFLDGVFRLDWTRCWEGICGIVSGLFETLKGILKGVVNVFIDLLNGLISGVNGVTGILSDIPGVDIGQIPLIPKLATGAVIPPNKPFFAMLGDQKNGTNIETPLNTMIEAFNKALDTRRDDTTSQPSNQTVILELDGREFGRTSIEQSRREERRIGPKMVTV